MLRDNESLIDIERAARRVLRYAADCDRSSLETNDEKASAILYQITIIGEGLTLSTRSPLAKIQVSPSPGENSMQAFEVSETIGQPNPMKSLIN